MYLPEQDGAHEDAGNFFPPYREWVRRVMREGVALGLDEAEIRQAGKLLDAQARELHAIKAEPLAAAQVLFICRGRA